MMIVVTTGDMLAIHPVFSVIKTTRRDQSMLSTELDNSTGQFCVLVCGNAFILINSFHIFTFVEKVLSREQIHNSVPLVRFEQAIFDPSLDPE